MQLREGMLGFDRPGTDEPGEALYRTSDNTFVLLLEDGQVLVFDRAEIHANSAPSMERARQAILNQEEQSENGRLGDGR